MKQSRITKSLIQRMAMASVLCLSGLSMTAQVLSPANPVIGRSYGQWTEAWWQWCYSLPASSHPLFDTADVSAGQQGAVWFLGGYFTGGPRVRSALIPPGKLLFFPL